MANVEQTIVDAADKLVKAVEVYGPKATSLVLETVRVAAMQDIVTGFAFAAGALIALSAAWIFLRKLWKMNAYDDGVEAVFAASVISVLLWLLTVLTAIAYLTSVFAWVGLQHPEIYLAAKLLKL